MTFYAIGDIHGQLSLLLRAHARVQADRARHGADAAPLVHVGDLVDRGPDSAGVIAALIAASEADPRIVTLLGNHDQMFLTWLTTGPGPARGDRRAPRYLGAKTGGQQTLASYDVDPTGPPEEVYAEARDKVPEAHRRFLSRLKLTFAVDDSLCVHAGLRPGIPPDRQDPDDLMWIRDEFLTSTSDHGRLIVHGHTVVDEVQHHGNRLAIDTGAAWGGPLSAVVVEGREVFVLGEDGRVPVRRLG